MSRTYAIQNFQVTAEGCHLYILFSLKNPLLKMAKKDAAAPLNALCVNEHFRINQDLPHNWRRYSAFRHLH